MDKEEALKYTNERIEGISKATYENEAEIQIVNETLEYLKFVKKILEGS